MAKRHGLSSLRTVVAVLVLGVQGGQAQETTPAPVEPGAIHEDTIQSHSMDSEEQTGDVSERGIPRISIPGLPDSSPLRPKIQIPHKVRPTIRVPPRGKPHDAPSDGDLKNPDDSGASQAQAWLGKFVPNQVIVKLRPGMSLPVATKQQFGLQPLRSTSGGHVLFRFVVPQGMPHLVNPVVFAQELAKQAAVLFALPNRIYLPDRVPNDPLFPKQWHFLENGNGQGQSPGGIGLPSVWDRTRGSRSVVVAVIDTGIVGNHPDIDLGNVLPGFDFISDVTRAKDGDGRDADPTDPGDGTGLGDCIPGVAGKPDTWHGNNVAGVIGMGKTNNAKGIAGVNWEVGILPVRVSGRCGSDDVDLYDAIKWAAGLPVPDAPLNQTPAKILNISLGSIGVCDRLIQEAINEVVTKKGVSIVVGAGNNSGPAMFHAPGNCQHVITVAASDDQGHLAPYSNFGPPVTIMAPGGDRKRDDDRDGSPDLVDGVLTLNHPTLRNPDNAPIPLGFGLERGTSLAAPHVSGVLALWLALDPTLTHAELVQGLVEHALPRNSLQCPRSCGAGLLNADLGSLIPPGKDVPPPPGKDVPPPPNPKQPPPVSQCHVKTSEIVQSMKIDIGNNDSQTTSAKQSLLRMMSQGDEETRRIASSMIKATENGTLAGIFQRNKGPVAMRGQRMTPPKGWWELIPQGQMGLCLKEPAGEAPMIIYRNQDMPIAMLDSTLKNAWQQCGLPDLPFPCVYVKDMGNKPQANACLAQAEKAYRQGEQQCDEQFGSKKACVNAYQECLATVKIAKSCEERVPCIVSGDIQQHDVCMQPFEAQYHEAIAGCE